MNPTPHEAAEHSGDAPRSGPPFTVEAFPVPVMTSDGIELEAEAAWPDSSAADDDSASRSGSAAAADDDSARHAGSAAAGTAAAGVTAVIVLSHPHPLYGGDMWNPLVDHLFRALPASGVATLRYNFRGVGRSGGRHDDGKAEQLDAAAAFDAAIRWATERKAAAVGTAPSHERTTGDNASSPLVVSAGWSFGGDVSLAADHDGLAAWVGIAAPLRIVGPTDMAAPNDHRPKLLLVPEHDQFRSPAEAAEITERWTNTRLEVVTGGDHFLMGHARAVGEKIASFVSGL